MKILRKIVFRKYADVEGLDEYNTTGTELEPPSVDPLYCLPGGVYADVSSRNVDSEWNVEHFHLTTDGMQTPVVAWRHTLTVREPGDEDYVKEASKVDIPLVPRQKLSIKLDLLTNVDMAREQGELLTAWLASRLVDCPFGVLMLEDIEEKDKPSFWTALTKDEHGDDES